MGGSMQLKLMRNMKIKRNLRLRLAAKWNRPISGTWQKGAVGVVKMSDRFRYTG